MSTTLRCALLALVLALVNVWFANAQLLPQVTPQTRNPPTPKPAQIVIQTSPNARVYLDAALKGQVNAQGRLVIENPKPGEHTLRIALAGKRDHEQKVFVIAGQVARITAALADSGGTLVIQTAPGAAVSLDGSSRGTADATGQLSIPDVSPGSHDLRISASGRKDNRQKITVSAGQGARIDAPLAELTGTVVVQTSPGAAVSLDGSSRGSADAGGKLVIPSVGAGAHELRITASGKKEYRQNISVPAGQGATIDALLESAGPPPPGTLRANPKDGLNYAWIPPGTFQMGCSPGDTECANDEKPRHSVTLTEGFWLGQTEVTVGAYKRFAAAMARAMPPPPTFNSGWPKETMPMVTVTWTEAHDYCAWAGGRLPSEAEWEYAARAGNATARYGPLDAVAWYASNSGNQPHPVGGKQPNGFHLYDVLGNTLEWVNDWYGEKYYSRSPVKDPPGPEPLAKRVFRGGNFSHKSKAVRVSARDSGAPGDRFRGSGFRCGGVMLAP